MAQQKENRDLHPWGRNGLIKEEMQFDVTVFD